MGKPRCRGHGPCSEGERTVWSKIQFLVSQRLTFLGELFQVFCCPLCSRGSLRSHSSEMSETHDIRDSVAFSDREIAGRTRRYEKWLQSGPNSWLAETRAICTPFVAGEPRPHFFSAIPRISFVALFRGSDSGSKNVAFFLASRRECKIIASEALNSDSSFRNPQFKPSSDASHLQQAQVVDFGRGSENSHAKGASGASSLSLSCANTSSE
jgi:hypothetical protein